MHLPDWMKLPLVAAALALAAPACKRDEVTHTRAAREAPPPAPGPMAGAPGAPAGPMAGGPMGGAPPGAGPMAGGDSLPTPPRPEGKGALKWTLPKGWSEAGSGGMRYATLKAPVEGKLDVSVVVLPGPAGGELANVNRWRGQIGLGPLDESGLDAARKPVRSRAGRVALYDFEGEGKVRSRMVGGLVTSADGNTWFIKMVGDSGPVAKARPDFIRIVESLRFE
jgi:hypothetical protein